MAKLSRSFRSLKPHSDSFSSKPISISKPSNLKLVPSSSESSPPGVSSAPAASAASDSKSRSSTKKNPWSVYLILSTNPPIKTYVGVTNNFSRRKEAKEYQSISKSTAKSWWFYCSLKQHNGDLRGGAKASRVGRPWVCACLINGFSGKAEACKFEFKWKDFSRRLSRQRKSVEMSQEAEDGSLALLRHRHAALCRVQSSIVSDDLDIDWRFDLS
ncbi:OLC1v1001311C12 [Oldenlandia corymbosa var. corymbosa]|uniref:OLC1v1001311C12 n=1 Tax=Oldenlandia corymbosa var. corymbosa TaxID=529605 RepID=A0AAV1D5R4_OLDCO|nr:OLC1v1001311C12 [Oldenlandia corymbosa var. corymbosa]